MFDLKDMEKIVKMIADAGDSSLVLTVEIYDDNWMKDALIGKVDIDLKDLVSRPATPWKQYFDLDTQGRVGLTLNYLTCFHGMCRITLVECRNLTNPDLFGKPDPYVYMTVKGNKKKTQRTKTLKDGGLDFSLNREIFNFWIDEDAFFNGLQCDVWDDDTGRDDLIGSVTIDLFQYAALATTDLEPPRDRVYPLRKGGEFVACVEFFPCVNLQIVVFEGKGLRNPNMIGKTFDPYLLFESESLCNYKGGGGLKLRSKTDNDGSKTPDWKEQELYGLLCDHKEMVVTCYDDDVGKDDFIGVFKLNLVELYKEGSLDRWWELKSKNGKKSCGEVKVKFTVKTARGVSLDVERKLGYPVGRELRGVGGEGFEDDVIVPYTLRGYGVKGRVYEKPVPARRAGASSSKKFLTTVSGV